jgi:hypothetical protein
LKDLKWPDLDLPSWSERARIHRRELTKKVAAHIGLLPNAQKPPGIPDYRGQFIHAIGESIFEALLARASDEVASLFGPYLLGTLALFDQLKPTAKDWDVWTEQQLQIAAAPVIDLLEISGCAKLLSELWNDEEIWTPIADRWSKLLQLKPDTLNWISAIIGLTEGTFQIPHRGLIRTNWEIRIQSELSELPRRSLSVGEGRLGGHITSVAVIHKSSLVRYCAKNTFTKGQDVFVVLYLSKQPGAEKLDWGRGANNLSDSLDHAQAWYQKHGAGDFSDET